MTFPDMFWFSLLLIGLALTAIKIIMTGEPIDVLMLIGLSFAAGYFGGQLL